LVATISCPRTCTSQPSRGWASTHSLRTRLENSRRMLSSFCTWPLPYSHRRQQLASQTLGPVGYEGRLPTSTVPFFFTSTVAPDEFSFNVTVPDTPGMFCSLLCVPGFFLLHQHALHQRSVHTNRPVYGAEIPTFPPTNTQSGTALPGDASCPRTWSAREYWR